jgi:hypothetical protein
VPSVLTLARADGTAEAVTTNKKALDIVAWE